VESRREIETAIQQLPESEIWALASWLHSYLDDVWDQQLNSDMASGRLDALISKAEADIASSQVRDLNEVLNNT
jgi:hypothetical protein